MNEVLVALQKTLAEKALSKQPNQVLSSMLNDAYQTQYGERKARRRAEAVERLGGRFEYVGNIWINRIMGNPIPITRGELRKGWNEELLPQLASTEESERPQLISRLAVGLMLSENSNSSLRTISKRTTLSNLFRKLPDASFSSTAKYFFQIISDISAYSEQEKAEFRDFIIEKIPMHDSGKLTNVFPTVAEWLVTQSRKSPQSARLS